MKKLLLVFFLMFSSPIFASGINANSASAPCDNDTLNKYTGTANVEINWEPNTISLNWYDGDEKLTVNSNAQSCTYDGTLTVPPAPTKLGYTFNGWKVIPVPGGCKRIEYIESTGRQYIDTGIKPNGDTSVEMKIQTTQTNNIRFFASYGNGAIMYGVNTPFYGVGYSKSGYWVNQHDKANNYTETISDTSLHVIWKDKNKLYVDNVLLDDRVQYSSFEIINNLYLLNGNNYPDALNSMPAKLYYCKIYSNNNLVRDFIPILDKNNVPCLWDKITGQFFYNAGTGNFIAGPEVQ